jgi:hypothetical protein
MLCCHSRDAALGALAPKFGAFPALCSMPAQFRDVRSRPKYRCPVVNQDRLFRTLERHSSSGRLTATSWDTPEESVFFQKFIAALLKCRSARVPSPQSTSRGTRGVQRDGARVTLNTGDVQMFDFAACVTQSRSRARRRVRSCGEPTAQTAPERCATASASSPRTRLPAAAGCTCYAEYIMPARSAAGRRKALGCAAIALACAVGVIVSFESQGAAIIMEGTRTFAVRLVPSTQRASARRSATSGSPKPLARSCATANTGPRLRRGARHTGTSARCPQSLRRWLCIWPRARMKESGRTRSDQLERDCGHASPNKLQVPNRDPLVEETLDGICRHLGRAVSKRRRSALQSLGA